jgi:hypothetical protein
MKSVTWKAQYYITGFDSRSVDDPVLVNNTDDRSDEIEVVAPVEPWHLGSFSAEQRNAHSSASVRHTRNHDERRFGIKLSGAEVVEEEQRFRATSQNVIHAVMNEILTDRVVSRRELREQHFRAHAVDTCDERRASSRAVQLEEATEVTEPPDDARVVALGLDRPDSSDNRIGCRNVYSGIGVAKTLTGLATLWIGTRRWLFRR